jgi:hypothetical protein
MLRRLKTLWCERHGHQFQEVGRVYEGPEGQAREVVLQACRICGTRRERPSTGEEVKGPPPLDVQERLDFLAKSRRRALRRARRKRRKTGA